MNLNNFYESTINGVFFQYCFEAGLLYKNAKCYEVEGVSLYDEYCDDDCGKYYRGSKSKLDVKYYSNILQFYRDLDYHTTTFKSIKNVIEENLEDILKDFKKYYFTKERSFTEKISNANELISNLEYTNLYIILYSALHTSMVFIEAINKHFPNKNLEIWCDTGIKDDIEYLKPDIIIVDEDETENEAKNSLAVGDLKAPKQLLNALNMGDIFNENMNLITVNEGKFLEKLHIPEYVTPTHFMHIANTQNKLFKIMRYAKKLKVQKIYWITPLKIYYYDNRDKLQSELLKFHEELINKLSKNEYFERNERFGILDYKKHLSSGDYYIKKEDGKLIIGNDVIGYIKEYKGFSKLKLKPYKIRSDEATLLLSRGFHRYKFSELLNSDEDIIINASGQGVGKNSVLEDYLKSTNAKILLITPRKIIINEMFNRLNGLRRNNDEKLKVAKCYRKERLEFTTKNRVHAYKIYDAENSSDKFFKLISENHDVILTTSQTLRFILTKINQINTEIKYVDDLKNKLEYKKLKNRLFDAEKMLAYKKFFQYFDLIVIDEYSANPDDVKSSILELIVVLNELKRAFPEEKFAKIVITDASLTDLEGFVDQLQRFVKKYSNGERVFYDKITMDVKPNLYTTIKREDITINGNEIYVEDILINDYLKKEEDITTIKNKITQSTKLQYYHNNFEIDNLSISVFKVHFKLPLTLYIHNSEIVEVNRKEDLLEKFAKKIIEHCKNTLKDRFDEAILNGEVVFYCDNIMLCDVLERELIKEYGNRDLFVVLHSQTDAERITKKLKDKDMKINIIGTSSLAYGVSLEKHKFLFIIPPYPESGWESTFYKDVRHIEKIRQVINRLRGSKIKSVYINALDFIFCDENEDKNIKVRYRYYDIKSTFKNIILNDNVVIKPQCVYLPLQTWNRLLFNNYDKKSEYKLLSSYIFAVEFFAQIRSALLQCGFKVNDFVNVNVKDLSILSNLYLVTSPMLTPFQIKNIKLFVGYDAVGGIVHLKRLVDYCLYILNECCENPDLTMPKGISLLAYVILKELNVKECKDGDIKVNLDGKIRLYKKAEIHKIIDEKFKSRKLNEKDFVNDILSKVYREVLKNCNIIMTLYLFNALFDNKELVSELYPFMHALIPPLLNVDVGNCINKCIVKLTIEDKDFDERKKSIGILTTHPLLSRKDDKLVMKLIREICYTHCICENQLPIPRLNKLVESG